MNRGVRSLILAFLIGFMCLLVGNGNILVQAQEKPKSEAPAEKKQQTGLVEDWLNDFEASEDWRATSTCPLGDTNEVRVSQWIAEQSLVCSASNS